VRIVAESFSWPFRGDWKRAWLPGLVAVMLLPLAFIPLLGYAIAATRAVELDAAPGPPRWALSTRLLADGFWTSLAVVILTAPFALAFNRLAGFLLDARIWPASDVALSNLYAHVLAFFVLALPWGLLMLLVMPHASARFAASGRPADLLNVVAAVRGVGHDFATWNLSAAAIVTGWAIGVACVGLLCAGLVPGLFYAILVSAHAAAALHVKGANQPAR
jgi:hypothetical protein